MKKKIAVGIVGLFMLLGLNSTVADAGAHHSAAKSATCNISGCTNKKSHKHTVCSVSGCTKTSVHKHNNAYYLGHHSRDGHRHTLSHSRRHH